VRETLEDYLDIHKAVYLNTTNDQITLGEARGKFIIFVNANGLRGLGIIYLRANIQDDYQLTTNWDLYDKWLSIKKHLQRAVSRKKDKFFINYLSGSGGSFPYFVASGHSSPQTSAPRLSTGLLSGLSSEYPDFPRLCPLNICAIYFEGTNILARNWIYYNNQRTANHTVGIIMADFPGDALIHTIIYNNWILRNPEDYLAVIPIEGNRNYYSEDYVTSEAFDYDFDMEF
jgi:1-phosphatidylinositol phosphodiesterase